jgi:dolichyl-phosphate beta-glucosyltransferase
VSAPTVDRSGAVTLEGSAAELYLDVAATPDHHKGTCLVAPETTVLVDHEPDLRESKFSSQIRSAQEAGAPRIVIPRRKLVDLEIVIPALNEERRIGQTLESVITYLGRRPYQAAIVVVDNGCVDGTADVVLDIQAHSPVTVHLINCSRRGKGAAVREGIMTSEARFVGFCDADLATPIEALDTAWPLLQRGARIVIGSRRCTGAVYMRRQPWVRRVGGWAFRKLANPLLPAVTDTQCGFKFFSRSVAHELFSRCTIDGFAFDVEVLALARMLEIGVHEVPVNWSDSAGSTFRPVRDGICSVGDMASVARSLLMSSRAPQISASARS